MNRHDTLRDQIALAKTNLGLGIVSFPRSYFCPDGYKYMRVGQICPGQTAEYYPTLPKCYRCVGGPPCPTGYRDSRYETGRICQNPQKPESHLAWPYCYKCVGKLPESPLPKQKEQPSPEETTPSCPTGWHLPDAIYECPPGEIKQTDPVTGCVRCEADQNCSIPGPNAVVKCQTGFVLQSFGKYVCCVPAPAPGTQAGPNGEPGGEPLPGSVAEQAKKFREMTPEQRAAAQAANQKKTGAGTVLAVAALIGIGMLAFGGTEGG